MVRQRNRTLTVLFALLLVIAQVLPVLAQDNTNTPATGAPIRVGSKEFTEQLLLGKMFVLLLREAGYSVDDQTGLGGSTEVRAALENNQIDLYPEYTGTALAIYDGLPADALPNEPVRSYELAKTLDQARGLVWLDAAPLNNTFALLVRADLVAQGIDTIGALAKALAVPDATLTICVESEFYGRADGLAGLEAHYTFTIPDERILVMESDEVYANLYDGNCDIAQGVATDGRVGALGFTVLEDDLAYFPFYQPAPVARAELLQTYPELAELLGALMALLDTPTITALNARVDLGADGVAANGDEETVEDVALAFLMNNGFVKPAPIRVASKEFTEQLLLGKLMVLLLRDAGFEVEDLTGIGGTAVIRQAIEAGEIDIYPEYTGTATSVHHNIPVTALPTTAERAYVLAKSLDAPQGLVWLDMMNFNNTYTLMVRQDLIDEGIRSIEDLASSMNANDSPLTLCVEGEFYARPDGLDGLQQLYGFTFPEENILVVETSDTYDKLRNGECDVAEGFATDGRINAWGFTNLEDSLAFFPFYNPTPVVRKEVLDLHPELAGLLNRLSALIDEATMSELNARVDIGPDGQLASGDEESVEDVAYQFLRSKRLVALPEVHVASTDASDGFQSILSNMLMLLLANAGYQPVDQTDIGASMLARQSMLRGDTDIYVESIINALTEYNELPVSALPTTRERAFALAQTLDKPNDIVWLALMPYVETVAIVANGGLADQGIESLDEFANYMNANDAPLKICMDNEFYGSEYYGLEALQTLYGFRFAPENILLSDREDVLRTLVDGQCDVAATSNIDAVARNFTALSDPLGFFLDFGSAPVVRKEFLDQNPEVADLINELTARIDTETVTKLDQLVELGEDGEADSGDELSAAAVARNFLVDAGLITPPVEDATPAVEETPTETPTETSTETPTETPTASDAGAITEGEIITPTVTSAEQNTAQPTEEGTPTPEEVPPADSGDGGDSGGKPVAPDSPTLTQRMPQQPASASAEETTIALAADGSQPAPSVVPSNDAIVVGAMADPEQRLIAAMLIEMLQDGGYPVAEQPMLGSSPDLRAMLEAGEIDLYPEFTGLALSLYHNIPPSALPITADGSFSLVRALDEIFNIVWIRKASFDSAYGFAVSEELAAQGVHTLFDLAARLRSNPGSETLCVDEAFLNDADMGLPSVATLYNFNLSTANIVTLDGDEIYRALRDGRCDVGKVLQTDGRIGAWNLFVLEDTQGAFPNYSPAPIARRDLLTRYPALEEYLGQLGPLLNSATMIALNAKVELGGDDEPTTGDEEAISTVAKEFLCSEALITNCTADLTALDSSSDSSVAPVGQLIPITSAADLAAVAAQLASAAVDSISPIVESDILSASSGLTETVAISDSDLSAGATTDGEVAVITVTTPSAFGVNIRAEASASAPVVAVLPRGTFISAIGRTPDSGWLQVTLDTGERAWVFTAAVVSQSEDIQQLPIVTP